jgi:O-antigen ligase
MPDLPASVRTSVYHRLEIWQFVAERISQRPLLGWGLEASRTLPGAQEPIDIGDDASSKSDIKPPTLIRMPLHPHNGFLQLWLELGVVGVTIASVLLIQLLAAIRRSTLSPIELAPSFAVVASALVVLSLSYGIWQSWWQSTLWLTAGIIASLSLQGNDGGAKSIESD